MTRALICTTLFALSAAVAQTPGGAPQKDVGKDAPPPNPVAPSPHVITLTVSATPAPVPALKYELLPKLRDRTPGNAALEYHRASLLRPAWPRDPDESRRQDQMVLAWEETPTDKLPVRDVNQFLAAYGPAFKALDQAARCETCDWQLRRHVSAETLGTVLSEVQQHRELTRFQYLRIRAALAENRFDEAARGLATGFRLGKDVAEGPTLIHMLVGIALSSIFTGGAEQWVARPESPNLYWALTALPRPFIDPRPALEGETVFAANTFPGFRELERGPVPADRANQLLEEMVGTLREFADGRDEPGRVQALLGKFGLAGYVALYHADAKKQLIALGRPAAEVEKMPPAQVVALRAVAVYRAAFDDQAKCFSLPFHQGQPELDRVRERVNQMTKGKDADPLVRLYTLTLPAVEKVYFAHARVERRLAGLRAVEAVRLHAAANNGLPPRALSDITLVPVPDDPNTGKPFEYAAAGNAFTLAAPPPPGWDPNPAFSFRYEVTVRGK
jgi:hypothetical protein